MVEQNVECRYIKLIIERYPKSRQGHDNRAITSIESCRASSIRIQPNPQTKQAFVLVLNITHNVIPSHQAITIGKVNSRYVNSKGCLLHFEEEDIII